LDQPSRATLRKYGVRFGAYHIYLPNLLKPAPRILAAQLWALKHAAPDATGLDELRALASGGRTSIPTDKDIPRPLYRTVGYRVCGERAVRVDILERLADLIRPALTWRDGSAIPKPPGAVEGGGFTVTQAMTSLTGASGEDFASVLRSLGYRAERRPKPAEVAAPAEPAAALPEAAEGAEKQPAMAAEEAPTQDAAPLSEPEVLPVTEAPSTEPAEPVAPAVEEVAGETSARIGTAPLPATETAPAAAETAPAAAAEEPAVIEVWRPGRPSERPRHGKPRRHRRPEQAVAEGAAAGATPVPAEAGAAAGTDAAQPQHRRPRPQHHRKESQGGKPRHQRQGAGQDRGQDRGRPPRRDREGQRERGSFAKPRPQQREKAADPNSPFAKLAALKAQLEADTKERR
jgi:ATP-dependent RNA helicase SUPV3L1/SUV3